MLKKVVYMYTSRDTSWYLSKLGMHLITSNFQHKQVFSLGQTPSRRESCIFEWITLSVLYYNTCCISLKTCNDSSNTLVFFPVRNRNTLTCYKHRNEEHWCYYHVIHVKAKVDWKRMNQYFEHYNLQPERLLFQIICGNLTLGISFNAKFSIFLCQGSHTSLTY